MYAREGNPPRITRSQASETGLKHTNGAAEGGTGGHIERSRIFLRTPQLPFPARVAQFAEERMKRLSMLCAAVAAVLPPAFAANTETPVVVTATRLDDVTRPPASITAITAEEIHRTPAKTLPELLSLEAGVFNRDLYGNQAARAKIDIRGFGAASSENVLILLDGRRLNDIDMSAVDFTSIPLGMIERVEITRGVGAVLYGDGAVGGVVNIITRQPGRAGRKGQAAFAAGTYNTRRIEANIEQGNGSTSFHLAAQGLHSDGYRVNNELDQGTLQADLRFAASGRESFLKFGADRYKVGLPAHRQVDASANVDLLSTDRRGATTPNDYSKRDGFHVSGGTTLFLPGNSQLILDVGYREKQDKASLSSFLDTTLAGWSFTPRLKTGSSVWGLPGSAVAGVDYFVSTYDSDRANNEAAAATPIHRLAIRQTSIAVYAQDTAELRPGTHFTLGARHQQVSSRARDTFNASAPAPPSTAVPRTRTTAKPKMPTKWGCGTPLTTRSPGSDAMAGASASPPWMKSSPPSPGSSRSSCRRRHARWKLASPTDRATCASRPACTA